MGRKCAVPHCYTGYRKCKEKASLYRVPDDDFFLSKWQEAIAREDRPITPKDYVCEKHFKDDDILRRRIIKDVVEEYQRPRLKPDAIPSIFPDLPEFILKMVKKRRKIALDDSQRTETCDNLKNTPLNIVEQSESYPNIEEDIKTEPIETNENENLTSTMCDPILNNEVDIKSESEENPDLSVENEEENEKIDLNFGPKMHKCDQCEYQTKYPHNLRTHKTKHLTGEEAYMYCKHCPRFKTKWELTYRNHLKIKHGIGKQEVFKCALCSFETKVKLCLKRHSERHQRILAPTNFSCDYPGCDFQNENKGVLDIHKLSHGSKATTNGETKTFKCPECLFETNSKTHIIKHIKGAHSAGDNTKVLINVSKGKNKTGEAKTREPQYKCLKCSYRSKTQSNLLKHVFKHNYSDVASNTPRSNFWKCPSCPFVTFFQQALQKHQETDCRKLFTCTECSFKSRHKPDFIKHTLTHRNVTVESVSQKNFVEGNAELRIENLGRGNDAGTIKTELEDETSNGMLKKDGEKPEFITVKSEMLDDGE